MITATHLDVTKLEPRLKHPTVFKHFDNLEPGEGFLLENDHDPKPLYYEILAERGNIFTWEYVEKGPEWFTVKIEKIPLADRAVETIGSIAAKDVRKAEILKAKGIDFSCGGNKTLKDASVSIGISEEELKEALNEADQIPLSSIHNYDEWPIEFLMDFIVNTHHRYVRKQAKVIYELVNKVAEHHSLAHPELIDFAKKTTVFLHDLLDHIHREEKALFPAIKALIVKQVSPAVPAGYVEEGIGLLIDEHKSMGEDMRFFRKETRDFLLPDDACSSYEFLFETMKAFENDLHQHIHLENNILFPKALTIEVPQQTV